MKENDGPESIAPTFEERLAAFLLDENREDGEAVYDVLHSDLGPDLVPTFEGMSRVHRSLEQYFQIRRRRRLTAFAGGSAIAAGLIAAVFFNFRPPEAEHVVSFQFGACATVNSGEASSGRTRQLTSGPLSVCDHLFHTAFKGRIVRIRLLPESEASMSLADGTWDLAYARGTILVESSRREFLLGAYPSRLRATIDGKHTAEFLGTRARIRPAPGGGTLIEVLDGSVDLDRQKQPVIVREGFAVTVDGGSPPSAVELTPEVKEDLSLAFSSVAPVPTTPGEKQVPEMSPPPGHPAEGRGDHRPDPSQILFPDATKIPGNRIILKDGSVHKGTGLLQKGSVYILLTETGAREFSADSILRIEFE